MPIETILLIIAFVVIISATITYSLIRIKAIKEKYTLLQTSLEIKINRQNQELIAKKNLLDLKENQLDELFKQKEDLFNSLKSFSNSSVERILSLFTDYQFLQFEHTAKYLSNKKRPAIKEALRIQELKKEAKQYFQQYKIMSYKYEYLLNLFPELTNFVEDFESIRDLENYENIKKVEEETDYVRQYISKEEYQNLSENERNQIALNNYVNRRKTNWQIGRDYELFCGQIYEKEGWEVEYHGMERKLSDLGRDLIAIKGDEVHIIQCKLWSKEKLIHEKHILQLYATTYVEQLNKNLLFTNYIPVFITNIELSETAEKFSRLLNVRIKRIEMSEFPRIKCNVTKNQDGTLNKIYHLPFDQQYDVTHIKNKDEFYASTIQEAYDKGFRRAFKYRYN